MTLNHICKCFEIRKNQMRRVEVFYGRENAFNILKCNSHISCKTMLTPLEAEDIAANKHKV